MCLFSPILANFSSNRKLEGCRLCILAHEPTSWWSPRRHTLLLNLGDFPGPGCKRLFLTHLRAAAGSKESQRHRNLGFSYFPERSDPVAGRGSSRGPQPRRGVGVGIRTRRWAERGRESPSLKSAELSSQCFVSVTLSERLGTKKVADSAEEVCFGIKFADRCRSSKPPRGAMATEGVGQEDKFVLCFFQVSLPLLPARGRVFVKERSFLRE